MMVFVTVNEFQNESVDSRGHPRQNLELRAQIMIGEGPLLDCTVRDICSGGAFLVMEKTGNVFELVDVARGDSVELTASVDGRNQAFSAKLAHFSENTMGLAFNTSENTIIELLNYWK